MLKGLKCVPGSTKLGRGKTEFYLSKKVKVTCTVRNYMCKLIVNAEIFVSEIFVGINFVVEGSPPVTLVANL